MVEYPIIIYDKPTWSVYVHINKINNKKYVGITSRKPQARWGKNGRGYIPAHGDNNHFYNAIKKYGWDNFEHKILIKNIDSQLASLFENMLIISLHSLEPYGYNSKQGGQLGTYGTKYSDTYVQKISGYNSTSSLEVICLNNRKRYGSAAEAQRMTNAKSVAFACREGKCSGKDENDIPLLWMYTKDYETKTEKEIIEILNNKPKTNIHKKIICLNTNEVFTSALQASKITDNVLSYGIHQACRGKYKYSGHHYITGEKLKWMYYDDYLNNKRRGDNE